MATKSTAGNNARACLIVATFSLVALLSSTGPSLARADDSPFSDLASSTGPGDLQDLLAKSDDTGIDGEVRAFYAARDFKPVWIDQLVVDQVQDVLAHADAQGLRPADYAIPEALTGAELEQALTVALFRYAHDVRVGRVLPHEAYKDARLIEPSVDFVHLMGDAVKKHAIAELLASLPPQTDEYRGLVIALAHYRDIAQQKGWPTLAGGEIVPGKKDKRIALLTKRLAIEDTAFGSIPEPTAEDIKAAIARYQERNGLPVDGRAGGDTLKQLNVPAAARVKAIVASMERLRWMPRNIEARYIRVNVPDQSADYVANGQVVLHSKVVIGKPTSPTPILRTEVTAVVANPAWDIPGDIATRQVLPHLRRDKNYLADRGFILANSPGDPEGRNIDWGRPSAVAHLALQQPPGPDNVLGKVMLDMPNDFDVYMHDTPNKKLFTQTNREASNGCVRTEQIFALASLALTGDAVAGKDRIDEAVATGETTSLPLDKPLPVYMVYSTAVADADGNGGFRPDRYNRDTSLLAAMAKPRKPVVMVSQATSRKSSVRTHPNPSPGSD